MQLNHLTQYHFNNAHGITGTLAQDPVFAEAKNGHPYAKLAIYCKAASKDTNQLSRHQQLATELPLIAYVCVFDEALLDAVDTLKKGYFVNFNYDSVTLTLGEDTETEMLRIKAFLTANHFEVRHVPKKAPVRKLSQASDNNPRETHDPRNYHGRVTRKKQRFGIN